MKPIWRTRFDTRSFLNAIEEDVDAALLQTAEDITDLTKQLAPVDTGDLRDSYTWEKAEDKERTYYIGSNPYRGVYRRGHPTTYGPYVEFGTSRSPAQPHFTPAFNQAGDILVARLGQLLKKRSK